MDNAILVSIGEAAARMGVSESLMKRLVRSGELPSMSIGDRRLIPVDELRRYVDRCLAEAHGSEREAATETIRAAG